ncbi:MAG: hypothetical protein NTV38_09870, partial [Chloroflexi bacterium]|nr:hypothetical protein [Chloroflexota bacterium]
MFVQGRHTDLPYFTIIPNSHYFLQAVLHPHHKLPPVFGASAKKDGGKNVQYSELRPDGLTGT